MLDQLLSAYPTGTATGTSTTPVTTISAPTATATSSGGSFTQGAPLPNITTIQQQATAAPSWYMDYLSNLAQQSQQAAQGAQYVGAQPLQQQAFNLAGQTAGQYSPFVQQAAGMTQGAAGQSALAAAQPYLTQAGQRATQNIAQYMNPYVEDVVQRIGALGQRQIEQNLAPGVSAGLVGSGQFGSKRGAEALGQALRDAQQNILAQQAGALQSGYTQALGASQADLARQAALAGTAGSLSGTDLARQLSAAQQMGVLGQLGQGMNLADLNALSTLGAQQQAIAQNQQLFPLQQLANQAQIMRGYAIPTATTSSYTGPVPGAYSASPLQQIMGIASLMGALGQTSFGQSLGQGVTGLLKQIPGIGSILGGSSGSTSGGTSGGGSSDLFNWGDWISSPTEDVAPPLFDFTLGEDWGALKKGGLAQAYKDGGDVRGYAAAGPVIPAKPPVIDLESEEGKQYLSEMDKLMELIQKKSEVRPNLFNLAGALLDPGRTGNVGEAIGRASTALGQDIAKQEEQQIPLAQARMMMASQKYQAQKAQALKQAGQNILQPIISTDENGNEKTVYKINQNAIQRVLKISDDPVADLSRYAEMIPKLRKSGLLTGMQDQGTPFDALVAMAPTPGIKQQAQHLAKQYVNGMIDEDKANTLAQQMLTLSTQHMDRETQQGFQNLIAQTNVALRQAEADRKTQEFEAKRVKEGQDLKAIFSSADTAIQQVEYVRKHPGRSEGLTAALRPTKLIPGTDAYDFMEQLTTLKSKQFLDTVQNLRGLGALSDAEGKKVENALASLNPNMSKREFDRALNQINNYMELAKQRSKDIFERRLPSFEAATSATPSVAPSNETKPTTSPRLKYNPQTKQWE